MLKEYMVNGLPTFLRHPVYIHLTKYYLFYNHSIFDLNGINKERFHLSALALGRPARTSEIHEKWAILRRTQKADRHSDK